MIGANSAFSRRETRFEGRRVRFDMAEGTLVRWLKTADPDTSTRAPACTARGAVSV